MIKHLITGGCSFSHYNDPNSWVHPLVDFLKNKNPNLTHKHTGYLSQGQELIQKKVMRATLHAIENGIKPEEILVVVMWSGSYRKAWYIDNEKIIREMAKGWAKFEGGMCSQFLDLDDNVGQNINKFYTFNGTEFSYNADGGWYFTVNGSDCQLPFVQQHYLLDGFLDGVGKTHNSLENIIMLQNYLKLNGVKFIQQFFMDFILEDIEKHKNHQIIEYLYKQLDKENIIKIGKYEFLHGLLGIKKEDVMETTHDTRKKLDKETKYFAADGFHPGINGTIEWCNSVLFPFLEKKI